MNLRALFRLVPSHLEQGPHTFQECQSEHTSKDVVCEKDRDSRDGRLRALAPSLWAMRQQGDPNQHPDASREGLEQRLSGNEMDRSPQGEGHGKGQQS